MRDASQPLTLGADLERRRLVHRELRLERALHALNHRMVRDPEAGRVPMGLLAAIRDFEHQLDAVRARIIDLPETPSVANARPAAETRDHATKILELLERARTTQLV